MQMKSFILTNLFSVMLLSCTYAQSNHLVISQVYGAGGNSDALFTHDYVELFNPTTASISLSGFSLQYASSSTASWSKLNLVGTIMPGHYFLVQLGSAGTIGAALPTADQTAAFGMSAAAGIVALLNSITITTSSSCPSMVIDLVGYGTSVVCKEVSPVASPGSGESLWRLQNGCTDSDNNANDFTSVPASPRNSSSDAHSCNGSVSIFSVSNLPFCINSSSSVIGSLEYSSSGSFANSAFTVYLSDVNGSFTASLIVGTASVSGTNPKGLIAITIPQNLPSGSKYYLRINASNPSVYSSTSEAFEIINGAATITELLAVPSISQLTLNWTNPAGCFDEVMIIAKLSSSVNGIPSGDGSSYVADANFAGGGTTFNGGKVVYKGVSGTHTINGLAPYQTYHLKAYTRRGSSWSTGVEISDFTRYLAAPGEIVINQLSPDYGTASDEYVELVNTTSKKFYLSDLAFAYQSATGTSKISAFLNGILQPHSYWLLSPNATITVGKTTGLTRDGSINSGLALNAQIAIVRKADHVVVDAVAYGNVTAGEYIESNPAIAPTVDGGIKRIVEGLDNNNNNSDFIPVSNANIELSNSRSVLANNAAIIPGGSFFKLYVTGNASLAGGVSIAGKAVLIRGKLSLLNNDLSVNAIEGGHSTSYIKTDGAGSLQIDSIGIEQKGFPVGNTSYNPLVVSSGSGLSWRVRVQDALQGVTHDKAVLKTWHIAPSSPPSNGATLEFEYNDGDANQRTGSFNASEQVYVWNNHNNTWQIAGLAVLPTGTPGGTRKVSLANWTQFSSFIITNVSGVLPVRFANEKLELKTNFLTVSWSNLTEDHVRVYEVERSPDAINYTKLADVLPVKNNGRSVEYSYVDYSQFTGKLYYRIKAVEQDGAAHYSKTVSLDTGERLPRLLIYPNPTRYGKVNLHSKNLSTGLYAITIFNVAGQQIRTGRINHVKGWPDKSFSLNDLKPGYYLFQLKGPLVVQQWFIIE